jgi:hypothetical protein
VFSIHAHLGESPVNYTDLFAAFAAVPPAERQETIGGRLLAIPKFEAHSGKYVFVAYSGHTDQSLLLFDAQTQQEDVQLLTDGQVVAKKTHGVIDPSRRETIVEYSRFGAKADQIAELVEKVVRRQAEYARLELLFNMTPAAAFVAAIDSFQRIQSARLKLARPNFDWTDFSTGLTTLADESGAGTIQLDAAARRTQSLSKDYGIVKVIKALVGGPLSIFRGAWITGERSDGSGLTTLNLNRFIESKRVSFETSQDGLIHDEDAADQLVQYAEERESNA